MDLEALGKPTIEILYRVLLVDGNQLFALRITEAVNDLLSWGVDRRGLV